MEQQSDPLDAASEHEQEMRDDAINEIRRRTVEHQVFAACQWCGEASDGAELCCAECRDDAEKAEMSARRNGFVW